MTFGAMAAWQAWLLIGAAAAAASLLFLLKVRPPRVVVPSLLLWRRVLSESRDMTLWERIRRAVSLAITAAIAVALALAFARPARAVGAAAGSPGRVLVVLDSSWSMLARTNGGGTRWDHAIADARQLAAAASGGEVAIATTADGLVEGPTSDATSIDAALDRIAPSGGGATAWPALAGADAVYFVTDGAIARTLNAGVTIHSVFEPAPNAGITAFDVRPALDRGAAAADAYVEIANFGPARPVHVTIDRGATSILDRRIDMAAGDTLRQIVPLARGGDAEVHARIDAPGDALAVDDEAFASIPRARPLAVTVVGSQPAWLAPLFADDPEARVSYVAPADYRPGQEDVVIFDRWAPRDPPERPALYFAPPSDNSWLAGGAADPAKTAAVEKRPDWTTAGAHPVLGGVDPSTLTIDAARGYGSPQLTAVSWSARGTPLVYVVDARARSRSVVVTFGPHESNLASAPAFPVLVGNALDWLARPATIDSHRPGAAAFDAAVERVTGPHDVAVPLVTVHGEKVGMLRSPGWYVAEGHGVRTTFAVNIADPDASNLGHTTAGSAAVTRAGGAAFARPWWLYCAIVAFAALLAEWWTWLRRITV